MGEEEAVKTSKLFYDSNYAPGEHSPFYSSDKPFADLEEDEKSALIEMVLTFSRTDVASRRFEVEQALSLDTPVPTPTGWKSQGDLVFGDEVFDENGDPCRVVKALTPFEQESYRITFDNDETIVAGALHLWPVSNSKQRRAYDSVRRGDSKYAKQERYTKRTTQEIYETYLTSRGTSEYSLDLVKPISLPEAALPIDPYLFGCWLGDGLSREFVLTGEQESLEVYAASAQSSGISCNFMSQGLSFRGMARKLEELGLGYHHDTPLKFIPDIYLRSSILQREELLRGLMDTDGCIYKRGLAVFTQTEYRSKLAHQVFELISSLGMKPSIELKKRCAGKFKEGNDWLIEFTPRFTCFKIPRKSCRVKSSNHLGKARRHYIKKVEPVGAKQVRCISVDSPNHLYVAGKTWAVTSNSWEACLFERGYQHLLPRRGGGWTMPGESNSQWGVMATSDYSSLFATNTYGRDHDIVCSALCREIPNAEFYPVDPKNPEDCLAADNADDYKDIFIKNNNLRSRQSEAAHYFFIDDRVILWTGYWLNGELYGYTNNPIRTPEEQDNQPEPEAEPEEQNGPISPDEAAALPPEPEEEEEEEPEKGKPNGRVLVKVYGKLASKVPIIVNEFGDMQSVQLYDDMDVTALKARYPWIADKIVAGSCGIGEVELDYIARLNTKLALTGAYVTGDSYNRQAVEQKTWFRPSAFFDSGINSDLRDRLLAKFPTGALVVMVGHEFAFAREESMDDHIVIAHPFPGAGQNRRALGSSLIGPQKRLNNWIDLLDDFFRSTVPKKWMDNDAFNLEDIKQQGNKPGDILPFNRQPGTPVNELVWVEPTPQPQPALPEFVMKFFLDVPQSLSGAVPSLFGGNITGQVGSEGYAMQRDQALERLSTPWNALKAAFSEVFRQAVVCAGANHEGVISDFVPGRGLITLDANDLKGSVCCYPEYDSSIPESAGERMMRDIQMIELATSNPYYAETLKQPSNILELANDSKISRFEVPGAPDIERQMAIIQVLLKSGPKPNPQVLMLQQKLDQTKQGVAQDIAMGKPIPPEAAQLLPQFEQQTMQQIQSLPPLVSSVPPRQDSSENHALCAATDLEWMNSSEGRKYEHGSPEDKEAFANVHLNWQEHSAIAAKIAQQNAKMPDPKESISVTIPVDKMPGEIASQIMSRAGITASPDMFDAHDQKQSQRNISEKVVPDITREQAISSRENRKLRR